MKTGMTAALLLAATFLFTGCHTTNPGGAGCSSGCADGSCGLLGHLSHHKDKHLGLLTGRCAEKGCPSDGLAPGYYSDAGPGQASGPLGDRVGKHYRGHQSHMGAYPGPAYGAPSPTVGYPYYTVRGPRDFLVDNPTGIGR